MEHDLTAFGNGVVDTLKIAGAISLGMILASYFFRVVKNLMQGSWKES